MRPASDFTTACADGDKELVKFMLKHGFNGNVDSYDGATGECGRLDID